SAGSVGRPRRRNTTFIPASGRESEANPSAAISSWKPKCSARKELDAATSSTFSDTADDVISKSTPGDGGWSRRRWMHQPQGIERGIELGTRLRLCHQE